MRSEIGGNITRTGLVAGIRRPVFKTRLKTIIDLEDADEFIIALSALIKRLAVDHPHIVGDVFDRGGSADKILDLLYDYHSLDIGGAITTF